MATASGPGVFPRYTSKVSASDETAKKNAKEWEPLLEKWHGVMEWAAQEGPAKHVECVASLSP